MARQTINVGSAANDGTGDTLRGAGEKINDNFAELYFKLGGDSDTLASQISLSVGSIVFEGSTADDYETFLQAVDPTADRTITIPDATDTIALLNETQSLANKTLNAPVLIAPQINDTSWDHQYIFAVSELTADRTITLPLLTGNDTFVFANHAATLTNKTLTAPAISSPSITTGLLDANGAESILLTATTSAVNEITVANAATGNAPSVTASGSDTNINVSLSGKGTGGVISNKVAQTVATMTANGTASSSAGMIVGNKATALAITLADGTVAGEQKFFICKGVGDTTITPTNFGSGTSVTIQQGESALFIWEGTDWYFVASYNGTLNA